MEKQKTKRKKGVTNKITIICGQCEKEKKIWPYEIKNGRRWCSRKCFLKFLHVLNIKKRLKTCLYCNKDFIGYEKIKFCSTNCSGLAKRKTVKCKCLKCNKEFCKSPSQVKKYCSRECYDKKQNTGGKKMAMKRRIEKRKNNPHLKLSHNFSNLVLQRLKRRSSGKEGKQTFKHLPYTLNELISHLESLFEPWMNWENYGVGAGKWTIDHIIPDSSFNYSSMRDKEFQKCWSLNNLGPLEFIKNIKKGNKII